MRGWDCLREPPLESPKSITNTKLRKYIATISQILSLKEELDWLARHLGHDIRVHREYYRLHDSTIEIAKVCKLLLAVDSGKARNVAGKSLDEITIDGKVIKVIHDIPVNGRQGILNIWFDQFNFRIFTG